jgi:hypothetical protein
MIAAVERLDLDSNGKSNMANGKSSVAILQKQSRSAACNRSINVVGSKYSPKDLALL